MPEWVFHWGYLDGYSAGYGQLNLRRVEYLFTTDFVMIHSPNRYATQTRLRYRLVHAFSWFIPNKGAREYRRHLTHAISLN